MKIKRLAIIVLMIIVFIVLSTTVQASTGKINSKEVKLRKKPDSSSTILDIIYKGDEVEILEHEDGWYKVKAVTSLGKVTGYVSEEQIDVQEETKQEEIKKEEPTENPIQPPVEMPIEKPTVSTDIKTENIEENKEYTIEQEVSIKAVPLINSREKAKINGNVKVIEIINNWSKIESSTETGWIRTNILKNSLTKIEVPVQEEQPEMQEPETKPEEKEEPEEITINKTGYVSTDGLRVRKGPSTDTEEIDSFEKNDKVKIIGKIGNWYKIDLDDKIGYVSAKYISDTKLPETTSRGGSTLKTESETTTETKQEENSKVEETPEAPAEPSTSGTTGTAIVEYAKKYLGYKYVSGGATPSKGFDCSGFTTYVYKHFGISLNRTSRDQIKNGVAVERSNLQPGDLVIFNDEANKKIGHVGIYIGDGNFIHASNPKDGVKITTLLTGYYNVRYVGARRVF